jgi:hypothetical protein
MIISREILWTMTLCTNNGISHIMPDISFPVDTPLCDTAHIPPEQWIRYSYLSTDPSYLHLREVRLEEVDLVLVVYAGRIGGGTLHIKMIVDHSCIDGSCCLRNKLSSPHGLAIPIGGTLERDLDTLAAA